jgi:hypothetical protein
LSFTFIANIPFHLFSYMQSTPYKKRKVEMSELDQPDNGAAAPEAPPNADEEISLVQVPASQEASDAVMTDAPTEQRPEARERPIVRVCTCIYVLQYLLLSRPLICAGASKAQTT